MTWTLRTARIIRGASLYAILFLLSGCSINSMMGWGAARMMDGGIAAMYREPDLRLAREAMPAQTLLLEAFVENSPHNRKLRLYTAQAHYAYAFAFIEDEDRVRAARLYERAFRHAQAAIPDDVLRQELLTLPEDELSRRVAALGGGDVESLFWTATALGKWVDTSRDDPAVLAHGFRAAALMARVMALDPDFFFGGPNLFFGAYLATLPAPMGGDPVRARQHFDRSRAATGGRLLIVDVLEAQLLSRQLQDRRRFHEQLTAVVSAPGDVWPEMAFINEVARVKAKHLLKKEPEWF